MRDFTNCLRLMRVSFLPASVIPVLLGTSVAWETSGVFSFSIFGMTLLGVICLHLSGNVFNEYYDWKSGADENPKRTKFSGGSGVLQEKALQPRTALILAASLWVVGAAIGLTLWRLRGPAVLWLGLAGAAACVIYTAPAAKLAYRGFGEATIALVFGVFCVAGAAYVQSEQALRSAWIPGLVLSFLVAAVIWVNEFPDAETDEKVGKRTLMARLGREKAQRVLAAILALAFGTVAVGVTMEALPRFAVLFFLFAPVGGKALYELRSAQTVEEYERVSRRILLLHAAGGIILCIVYVIQGVQRHWA